MTLSPPALRSAGSPALAIMVETIASTRTSLSVRVLAGLVEGLTILSSRRLIRAATMSWISPSGGASFGTGAAFGLAFALGLLNALSISSMLFLVSAKDCSKVLPLSSIFLILAATLALRSSGVSE